MVHRVDVTFVAGKVFSPVVSCFGGGPHIGRLLQECRDAAADLPTGHKHHPSPVCLLFIQIALRYFKPANVQIFIPQMVYKPGWQLVTQLPKDDVRGRRYHYHGRYDTRQKAEFAARDLRRNYRNREGMAKHVWRVKILDDPFTPDAEQIAVRLSEKLYAKDDAGIVIVECQWWQATAHQGYGFGSLGMEHKFVCGDEKTFPPMPAITVPRTRYIDISEEL